MRRTFLAVGLAVLTSMLFAPHQQYWHSLGAVAREAGGTYYVPDWCTGWYWFPVFWRDGSNPILWGNFFGQTAFIAVFAAVVVNLRKSRTRQQTQ
jgi:hypothetical protein